MTDKNYISGSARLQCFRWHSVSVWPNMRKWQCRHSSYRV